MGKPAPPPKTKDCPKCEGRGFVYTQGASGPGFQRDCTECGGTGKVPA